MSVTPVSPTCLNQVNTNYGFRTEPLKTTRLAVATRGDMRILTPMELKNVKLYNTPTNCFYEETHFVTGNIGKEHLSEEFQSVALVFFDFESRLIGNSNWAFPHSRHIKIPS